MVSFGKGNPEPLNDERDSGELAAQYFKFSLYLLKFSKKHIIIIH